jgi:hypothetical protein
MRRLVVPFALSLAAALATACGGSSSETPPPLRPVPANVHYDRSATTLPGELGGDDAPDPDPKSPPPKRRDTRPPAERE